MRHVAERVGARRPNVDFRESIVQEEGRVLDLPNRVHAPGRAASLDVDLNVLDGIAGIRGTTRVLAARKGSDIGTAYF